MLVISDRVSFLESCWFTGYRVILNEPVFPDYLVGEPTNSFSFPFFLVLTGELINFYYEIR